ncbi:MAG: 4Fe-4S dicluster domain-containing protein [bacterium]|nr:4Fe-4S dicluster domain-containing protein [bacterium]
MRESTKALFKKHGWRIDRGLHNYFYFVFYYPYVKSVYYTLRFAARYFSWCKPLTPLFKAAINRYHSKVLSWGDTRKIFVINEDISAISEKNKSIVPYKYAYKILLSEPEHIAVMDCPCKKTLKDEDWTISSCIAVGKGLSSFWLDHGKKYNARKISQEEAIEIIKKLRAQGYLTQAFFKVATGGSTGVICNCKPETCVSLQATSFSRRFRKDLTMNAESGYTVSRDTDRCTACGTCVRICPMNAMELRENAVEYNKDRCLGCELCVEHCPNQALTLHRDPNGLTPLDLDIIKEEYISK